MTIRTRLTFLYSSLLAIVILMFSAATTSVLNWTLRNQVDITLVKAVTGMHTYAQASFEAPNDSPMPNVNSLSTPGMWVQIWSMDAQGQHFQYRTSLPGYNDPLDPDALSQKQEVRRDVVVEGAHLRVVTVPFTINGQIAGHIQAAASLRTVDAAIDRLLKIMLIGGAASLLASLLLGDILTRRALQPIDDIAQTAQQITAADDLGRRIPYKGPQDELGQLTTTFNETLERLERLFNAQRRFVADVSHEMRTPLTSILGNVELMQRYGYDTEAMDAIQSEASRMSRLVGDLLLLAKADAGRLSLEQRLVELDTLVLEVYNQVRQLSKDEPVEVHLGQIDQAQVIGDPDRLKQLLLNLVTNGVKYTPAGGKVTLSMSRDAQFVTVQISDTGIGIAPEHLPHIFDRFYRVDKDRSRANGGTGLGLSIAKWIADTHGGRLHVLSTLNEGSTFSVQLPLAPGFVPPESLKETIPHIKVMRVPRPR